MRWANTLFYQGTNLTFDEVFSSVEEFREGFAASPFSDSVFENIDDSTLSMTYYLLSTRYGSREIGTSQGQFQLKLFLVVAQYAPVWRKQLEEQKKLLNLSDAEKQAGTKQVFNSATNPESLPSTSSLEELPYVNAQSTNNVRKSKIEASADYLSILSTDFTEFYLDKFKSLFKSIIGGISPVIFEEDDNE